MRRLVALFYLLAASVPALAHEYVTFEKMGAAFGCDMENTTSA